LRKNKNQWTDPFWTDPSSPLVSILLEMIRRIRSIFKRQWKLFLIVFVSWILFLVIYFPGEQLPIAVALASGIGSREIQEKIDKCESKAIAGESFEEEEILFLKDLYTCLYKGAKLLLVLSESSKMMEHYLQSSGEPLMVDSSIFSKNKKVVEKMEDIEKEILDSKELKKSYPSETFYMPDSSSIDSVFGLYYGHIEGQPVRKDDEIEIHWYAEVPWEWPSYESLKQEYGDYHAESFPIPNATFLFLGNKGAIYIDNGLGEHITHLGIAKSFKVYAKWTSTVPVRQE